MSITTAGRGLSAGMVTEVTTAQLAPILLASLPSHPPPKPTRAFPKRGLGRGTTHDRCD